MDIEQKELPPALSLSKVPTWIASTPSDYDFPHSPAARESAWDSFDSQIEPELQKTQSLNTNSETTKEVQGMKINRVLTEVKPSEMQGVGSCFLKRCDSVARRSKAYEAAARTKCAK